MLIVYTQHNGILLKTIRFINVAVNSWKYISIGFNT